jgi:hypothetical protein
MLALVRAVELLEDCRNDAGRALIVAAFDHINELLTARVFEQLRGRICAVETHCTPPIEVAQRRRAALKETAARSRWSLCKLLEGTIVGRQGASLRAGELALAATSVANRSDDQPFTIRRDVQLRIGRNTQQVEDWFVDDDARAISDRLETFDHVDVIELRSEHQQGQLAASS